MKFLTIIVFLLLTASLYSQIPLTPRSEEVPKQKFTDRLFFGGYAGLQFGSEQTYVEIAPMIGVKVTERFLTGLNLKYIYNKVNIPGYDDYVNNVYGGGPFARYFVYEGLFAHFEYELINMTVPVEPYPNVYKRQNISSVFVGGGYRQMIGSNAAFDILILYNINETNYSPYVNPIFRFGFAVGL